MSSAERYWNGSEGCVLKMRRTAVFTQIMLTNFKLNEDWADVITDTMRMLEISETDMSLTVNTSK